MNINDFKSVFKIDQFFLLINNFWIFQISILYEGKFWKKIYFFKL